MGRAHPAGWVEVTAVGRTASAATSLAARPATPTPASLTSQGGLPTVHTIQFTNKDIYYLLFYFFSVNEQEH